MTSFKLLISDYLKDVDHLQLGLRVNVTIPLPFLSLCGNPFYGSKNLDFDLHMGKSSNAFSMNTQIQLTSVTCFIFVGIINI